MSRLGLSIAASLAIVLALFASASPVDAWARKGHRIIGLIARDQLSPEAKAAVRQLMGSDDLPKFSLYLDLIKDDLQQQIPGSRAWHYDNVPVCKTKARDQYCHAGNCASGQIARHHQLLRDAQEPNHRKHFAIFVITHLIGDVHQPLHAADNDDRGGNRIEVQLTEGRKKEVNLHTAWDTSFIEQLFAGKNEQMVAKNLAEKFVTKSAEWRKGTVDAWIAESNEIAKAVTYAKLPGFACGTQFGPARLPLTAEYVQAAEGIVEEQLAKAGYRLAHVLNLALGE